MRRKFKVLLGDTLTAMATSLKLPADLKQRLQLLADRRRRTPHWLMQEAIREFVEREDARDRFVDEALAAWTEFRETGRHLSGSEARAWLESWGDDGGSPPPACHE